MSPPHLHLRLLFPFLVLLATACTGQKLTYLGDDGKTYVRLQSKQPKVASVDSGYDADLLLPHWNPAAGKWGSISACPLPVPFLHRQNKVHRP
jgi:hypothetical protein